MKKFERLFAMYHVRPVEKSHGGFFGYTQVKIEFLDFRVFGRGPFQRRHAILVAMLHHEGPGRNQRRHFGVVERVGQVELHVLIRIDKHERVLVVAERAIRERGKGLESLFEETANDALS